MTKLYKLKLKIQIKIKMLSLWPWKQQSLKIGLIKKVDFRKVKLSEEREKLWERRELKKTTKSSKWESDRHRKVSSKYWTFRCNHINCNKMGQIKQKKINQAKADPSLAQLGFTIKWKTSCGWAVPSSGSSWFACWGWLEFQMCFAGKHLEFILNIFCWCPAIYLDHLSWRRLSSIFTNILNLFWTLCE